MARANNPSRGVDHYNAKLNDDKAAQILALVERRSRLLAEAAKLSDAKIAAKFGVHKNTVWKVYARASWVHVRAMW